MSGLKFKQGIEAGRGHPLKQWKLIRLSGATSAKSITAGTRETLEKGTGETHPQAF